MKVESSATLDSSARWKPNLHHMGFLGWGREGALYIKVKIAISTLYEKVVCPFPDLTTAHLPQPMGGTQHGVLCVTLKNN